MSDTATVRLRTTGMHCQSCSMLVQMNVEELPGVEAVSADVATGLTEVSFDPSQLTVDDIVGAIVAAGYGAEPEE
jgi:copper chaperone CopZ